MKKNTDIILVISTLFLGLWGVLMVMSTTINTANMGNIYIKQAAALLIGFMVLVILRNLSYKILEEMSFVLYLFAVIALLLVFITGVRIHGGKRWLHLGFLYLQPVEFAKVAVILFIANIIEKKKNIMAGIAAVAVIIFMVMAQPDAGSAMLFVPVFLGMLAVSHYDIKWIYFTLPFVFISGCTLLLESYLNIKSNSLIHYKSLIVAVAVSALAYFVFTELKKINKYMKLSVFIFTMSLLWISLGVGIMGADKLRDYQKKRIVSFLAPDIDPLGAGYNTMQSILAVGSGKILGKGLFAGTQTQLGFLPVNHTDFIFASVAEELGFAGAFIMLFMLCVIMWQTMNIFNRSEDYGGRLIAAGIFSLIFTQTFLNTGVVLGLAPVIGIQLPFVSSGGSGMVAMCALIGILLNINQHTEIIGE